MATYLRALWFLLLMAASQLGVAQPATWQRVALDATASIEFPDSVIQRPASANGSKVYVSRVGPSIFIAVQQPHNQLLGLLGNNRDFINGMVKGLLRETGGKLLQRTSFEVNGFSGVEVQFATPQKPQLPATKFSRLLMVNGTVYNLSYWTDAKQDAASVAERTQFFSSLQVAGRPGTVGRGAYWLGLLAGGLLAGVLVVGLVLVAILYLVRRRNPTA